MKVVERRGEIKGVEEEKSLSKKEKREEEKKKILRATYGRKEWLLGLVLEI